MNFSLKITSGRAAGYTLSSESEAGTPNARHNWRRNVSIAKDGEGLVACATWYESGKFTCHRWPGGSKEAVIASALKACTADEEEILRVIFHARGVQIRERSTPLPRPSQPPN